MTSHSNFALKSPPEDQHNMNIAGFANMQDGRFDQVMSNQTVRLNELKHGNRVVSSTSNVLNGADNSTLTKNNSQSPERKGISMVNSHYRMPSVRGNTAARFGKNQALAK